MSKICCFTGHRKISSLPMREIESRLRKYLSVLIEKEDFTEFRTGGATGFDSVAALTILKLKKQYPHIKLHLLLPCPGQDKYFTPLEKSLYQYTLEHADSVTYIQNYYTKDALFARNRALVDGSDLCVACLERLEGGTYYTVSYARKQGIKAINIMRMQR